LFSWSQTEPPIAFYGSSAITYCPPKETPMLNNAITEYIRPSLPSRIDVDLRIRVKR
jgi:hypothetical protein